MKGKIIVYLKEKIAAYILEHYHAIFAGAAVTLLGVPLFFGYVSYAVFGVTPKQLVIFVTTGNPEAFKKSAIIHLREQERYLEDALRVSYDRSKGISDQVRLGKVSNPSQVLDISARDRDIVRFSLVLAGISNSYLNADGYPKDLRAIVDDLINAYMEIQRAEVLDKGELRKDPRRYANAASILIGVYEKSHGKYKDIELEALRNLTFCEFNLGRKEKAAFWRTKALELRKAVKPSLYEYKWKWFWVDFNDLIISLADKNVAAADEAFSRLRTNSDPDFLLEKLLQHRKRVAKEEISIWDEYLRRVGGSTIPLLSG